MGGDQQRGSATTPHRYLTRVIVFKEGHYLSYLAPHCQVTGGGNNCNARAWVGGQGGEQGWLDLLLAMEVGSMLG